MNNAQRALFSGVTTVRDVFSPPGVCRQLLFAAKKGFLRSPRIIYCNRALTITGGIDWKSGGATVQVDGEDEVIKAIRTEIREGAEWIKMMTSWRTPGVAEFSQAEMNAAVNECHRLGKKIAAHSTIHPSLGMCIEAGFDTIEHGTNLTLEQAARMCDKGMAWVPTIFVHKITFENLVKKIETQGCDSLTDREKQTHKLYGSTIQVYRDNFLKLADTGVTVLAGTDIVFEGGDAAPVANELKCMTDFGFDNLRAIATATSNAAKVLGMEDEIGSFKSGAKADILVVNGDVSKDISTLNDIEAVYLDGKYVRREI
jgi:imidazolonepropionase-like amidohydrolase